MAAATPRATNARTFLALYGVALSQGLVGVLAKSIPAPATALVLGRCTVAAAVLALVCRATGRGPPRARRARAGAALAGLLLAGHWLALFVAYKRADVGPVLVAVFTFPVMTSLLEPALLGGRPGARQLGAALAVAAGVAGLQGLAPAEVAAANRAGVALALLSAACFALRNVLSRRLMEGGDALGLMAVQTAVAALALSPALVWLELGAVPARGYAGILVLGVLFTALPHTVVVWAMGRLSAATVGIVGTQQVLFGIVFAWALLGEPLHAGIGLGAAAVIGAVALESRAHWRAAAPPPPRSEGG